MKKDNDPLMTVALKKLKEQGWFKVSKREEWQEILSGERWCSLFILAALDYLQIDFLVIDSLVCVYDDTKKYLVALAQNAEEKQRAKLGRITRTLESKQIQRQKAEASLERLANEIRCLTADLFNPEVWKNGQS